MFRFITVTKTASKTALIIAAPTLTIATLTIATLTIATLILSCVSHL